MPSPITPANSGLLDLIFKEHKQTAIYKNCPNHCIGGFAKMFAPKFCWSFCFFLFAFQIVFSQSANEPTLLETGKQIERKISGNEEKQEFQISLNENQFAKIIIEQTEVDVIAELFGADGNYVTRYHSEVRLKEKENIEFVASQAGNYRLRVQTTTKKAAGSYKILLAEIRTASEREKLLFESHTLLWKAADLRGLSKYSEALPFAVRALEIAEKELGTENVFVSFIAEELGGIQRELGNYPAALSLIQRAIAVNEKLLGKEHPQTVQSIQELGLYYRRINDYPKAEQIYRQNLEISERILGKNHPRIAAILNALALIIDNLGDDVQAENLYLQALKITEENLGTENQLGGNIINNLGVLYLLSRKDYDLAEKYLLRGLEIQGKLSGTETSEYSNRLQNLGIIYRNRKQYAKALEFYERALLIREKALGKEHQNIGFLLNNIANIYKAKGDYDKALEIQRRVLGIAEKSVGQYHSLTLTSIGNTATVYTAKGDYINAVAFQKLYDERFEKIITLDLSIGSERQKLAYTDFFPGRTSRTISLHLQRKDQTAVNAAALAVIQRKGRVLDAVAANLTALRERANAGDRELLDQLNKTTAQLGRLTLNKPAKMTLDEYRQQIADLESQKEKIEREISNRVAGFSVQSPTVTLEAIRAAIPSDAALLEFAAFRPFDPKAENNDEAYGAERLMVYAIRRDGEIFWQDLGETKLISTAITDWRKALRDPKRTDAKKLARTVDEKIMQPVRALLGDAKKLLISPDGDLNLIPFEALVDEKGKYLIENYSISYLTSGRDLLRMKTVRPDKSDFAIIANPAFSANQEPVKPSLTATRNLTDTYFAPLTATIQEAQTIKNLFPEAVVYSEANATETTLKQLAAPRVLHIATHGFFLENSGEKTVEGNPQNRNSSAAPESENPLLRSGIALAGANQRKGAEDGILTALEASGLNLWGTKLVVLSACDTGLGEVKTGEGVYGLRRAFTLAGTESLVMSLWSVSDFVTRELMTDYYKNLKSGIGRGESLRKVQLQMLKKKEREHPFYWAAFIHSGDWRGFK
jgi:CHAT domain-containing protein/Tfp pilus assembly protein PilF